MKKTNDRNYCKGKWIRTHLGEESPERKINTLLKHLLEAEEEVATFKSRLKELEDAFYYNLEIISERDLELSFLEEKLNSEDEFLKEVIQERNELKNLLKIKNDKNERKLQQLEKTLLLKEQELKNIQRDHEENINSLKILLEDVKQEEEKKVQKICLRFESQKKDLIRSFEEQMEEKEQYYVLEIDKLEEKLAQANQKNEKLTEAEMESQIRLENLKQQYLKKESQYLDAVKKHQPTNDLKVSKEIQCDFEPQRIEKKIQAEPEMITNCCQTDLDMCSLDEDYAEKINFLLEQNEVLKYIIKDLKKNRDTKPTPEFLRCECSEVKTEIEQINRKFEIEINNLKKILEEELRERAEEDVMICNLEANVSTLKEKSLLTLQEKLNDFGGDDLCLDKSEIQNEIQLNLLERKLSEKLESIMSAAEEENKKLQKKLEELKKECFDKIEKCLKPQESSEVHSEDFLAKIRSEILKIQNKIESDVKNLGQNNSEMNKCDKNFQTSAESIEKNTVFIPDKPLQIIPDVHPKGSSTNYNDSLEPTWFYNRNDLSPPTCIKSVPVPVQRRGRQVNIQSPQKRVVEQRKLRKGTNVSVWKS